MRLLSSFTNFAKLASLNILFLTMAEIHDVFNRGIYSDLLRTFRKYGHNVYIITPRPRKYSLPTEIVIQDGVMILKVKTLNLQKTNIIEKGIGILLLEIQYRKAITCFLKDVTFDLILYSTPPITFTTLLKRFKRKSSAKTYLLLKDIFPQNAIDIGMMKKNGFLYKYFRRKEKRLYELSDFIGCMSLANVNYLLEHNSINSGKVEVCPNSIELTEEASVNFKEYLANFNIPLNASVFIYGGNLGKPQGLDFLLEILQSNDKKEDRYFLIVGSGTEFPKIKKWFTQNQPVNAQLIPSLPKNEYDNLVKACDVGLIFLDSRFTIPNFPSRLLSYLEYKMPVLLAIDKSTDIGKIAEENGFGYWSINGDLDQFNSNIEKLCRNKSLINSMGFRGFNYLKDNYTVERAYDIIMKHFN